MVNRAGVIEFGTSYSRVNPDVFYVTGRPKADSGLMKVLETVGNTLAEEKSLPKPGSKISITETGMEVMGCPAYSETSAYMDLAKKVERLKKGAGMGGLWVNFEFDDRNGSIVKTEVIERKKLPGLAEEVTKSHYFKVKGYVSHTYPLSKNIDLITTDENLGKVKAAIEENGREKTLYSLLDEFMSYSPAKRVTPVGIPGIERPAPVRETNTENVFGLGDDRLYTDLKGLLKEEVNGKYDEVNSSRWAGLSDSKWKIIRFVGSTYRESETGKIEEYRAKKEKQIDDMRKRFSEPYKSTRANAASFTK